MELNGATKGLDDDLPSSQQLGSRHDQDAERANHHNTEPLTPRAEASLLGDGHDEAGLGGEAAPSADEAEGAVHADRREKRIIRVAEGGVEPQLGAHVARRNGVELGRSWNVGKLRLRRGGVAVDGDARLTLAPLQLEAPLQPGALCALGGGDDRGFGCVHVLPEQVEEGVGEALGDVGGAMGAKPELLL